jgi:hypothetical protein
MQSFRVNCPHCGELQDFTNDGWDDCLVDDSEDHDMNCMDCEKEYTIRVHATYLHEVVTRDED